MARARMYRHTGNKMSAMFMDDEDLVGRKQRESDERGKNRQNRTIRQGIDEYFESNRNSR